MTKIPGKKATRSVSKIGSKAVNVPPPPKTENKSLFDISRELTEFDALIESAETVTPELEERISQFLLENEAARDKKITAICYVIRKFANQAEFRKTEAKRITRLATVDENKVKRLRWMILNFMQTHRIEVVDTPLGKVRRKMNGTCPLILSDWAKENPSQLDERFRRSVIEANLPEIRQALVDGEKLDFAWLGDKGESIVIE